MNRWRCVWNQGTAHPPGSETECCAQQQERRREQKTEAEEEESTAQHTQRTDHRAQQNKKTKKTAKKGEANGRTSTETRGVGKACARKRKASSERRVSSCYSRRVRERGSESESDERRAKEEEKGKENGERERESQARGSNVMNISEYFTILPHKLASNLLHGESKNLSPLPASLTCKLESTSILTPRSDTLIVHSIIVSYLYVSLTCESRTKCLCLPNLSA